MDGDIELVYTITNEERRQIRKKLYLFDRRELLENLVQKLQSTKIYFSREDRYLISLALRTCGENVSSEIMIALKAPPNIYIPTHLRNEIAILVSGVLNSGKLDNIEPVDDNQRFGRVTDGNEITKKGWKDLLKMGVHQCSVYGARKIMVLFGTKPSVEFFEELKKIWGFTDPARYFHYIGESPISFGTLD